MLRFVYTLILAVLISVLAFPMAQSEVRKVTQPDVEWGPSTDTVTSAGGHVGGKLPRYYDNNAFTDNLTLYSNDLITKGPWVDVRVYGAKFDNVTDDTATINAASVAMSATGGTLVFPDNTAVISNTITTYSNVHYTGTGKGGYSGAPSPNHGTMLRWAGASSGVMVKAHNTFNTEWDGINLMGNLNTDNTSTVVGIEVESQYLGGTTSQKNRFRNFETWYCDYGITFSKNQIDSGNTDGWIIEDFYYYFCNYGIYTNSINVAYSEIRNGLFLVYKRGIWLDRSGWIKITSVSGSINGNDNTMALIVINDNSGIVTIENSQSEKWTSSYTKPAFVLFEGGTRTKPTTFIGNAIYNPINVYAPQNNLVFIGNHIWNTINLVADNTHVMSLGDYEVAGTGFTITGSNVYVDRKLNDGKGTWTPRLYQGATEIIGLNVAIGTYMRVGDIVNIYMYLYKGSGAPSDNGVWTVTGLPFASNSGNRSIIATGETYIIDNNAALYTPHWWTIADGTVTLTLNGLQASKSWTSGAIVFEAHGTYRTKQNSYN